MNLIQEYEAGEIARLTAARAVPVFAPGDTVKVSVNIKEGRALPRAGRSRAW